MRVLVACEFSGVVRNAFRARGHDAWSCDLLPAEDGSEFHFQKHVRVPLSAWDWDLMIAHPPCTHLAVSGARWFKDKQAEQAEALSFVRDLMAESIPRICIENPISIISSRIRKPDQIIQPWMFGHPEFKATCMWLKNLPKLTATNNLKPPTKPVRGLVGSDEFESRMKEWRNWSRVHHASPGPDRWKERSRTLQGIADAMADQWGHPPRCDLDTIKKE